MIFLSQFYPLGGAEKLAVNLAEELNGRGIHADILSMYTDDLPGVQEAKELLLSKGIPSVYFLGLQVHPRVASVSLAVAKFRRFIQSRQYDIVETSKLGPSVMASWGTMGTQARHVAEIHRVFRRDRENSKRHQFWRLSLRCNARVRYYAVSEFVADHWVRYSGTSRRHLRRLYNGIPNELFSERPDREGIREELGLSQNGRVAVYVGRLAAFKGISTLLEALGPILERQNLYLSPHLSKIILFSILRRVAFVFGTLRSGAPTYDRVRFLGYRHDIPRLMASGEGKTTLAVWLARLAANSGERILLIDCDFRRPTVHSILQIGNDAGLVGLLTGKYDLGEVLTVDKASGAHVITTEKVNKTQMGLIGSEKLKLMIGGFRDQYDLVVIDSPPLLIVSDAKRLSRVVDKTIYLARWESTPRATILAGLKQLLDVGANVAGVVLTKVNMRKHGGYGYSGGYYYRWYEKYYSE